MSNDWIEQQYRILERLEQIIGKMEDLRNDLEAVKTSYGQGAVGEITPWRCPCCGRCMFINEHKECWCSDPGCGYKGEFDPQGYTHAPIPDDVRAAYPAVCEAHGFDLPCPSCEMVAITAGAYDEEGDT